MRPLASSFEIQKGVLVSHTWKNVLGSWLGIGTAPGALIVGAGLANRYGGPIPIFSIFVGFAFMFTIVWISGMIGMAPPYGEGLKLTELTPRYFNPGMQKMMAALIAVGMTGWFGFNVGLGGAALSALLKLPGFLGPILIGVPILILSLKGIKGWNGLAAVTTIVVIILVVLVTIRFSARILPFTFTTGNPYFLAVDMASFVGYISVFSIRSADFTAGFKSRKDLLISNLLLCLPVVLIALAGVGLQLGTGSSDLVGILAQPGGLAIGNLLVFLAVIAPTFTILYSGAPALKAAIGLDQTYGMYLITALGLILAIARFDLYLLKWLVYLAALFPPILVPFAAEATRRRRGHKPHLVSLWLCLPGASSAVLLTILGQPLAVLIGILVSILVTLVWLFIIKSE
jgi:hypothetical protein